MNELTNREKEICKNLVLLRSVELVAEKLDISKRTVHFHLHNIYKKLDYPLNKRNQMRLVLDWERQSL